MTKFSIVKYPQKILKQKAETVLRITPEIKRLIPQMIETMYANEGIGLAAPQIGISRKIIVVETSNNPRDAAKQTSLVFLNPTITKKFGKAITQEEGCLSLPGIFVQVKRPEHVLVECQTPDGNTVSIEAKGLTARIFQHEIDHLNGKLIIDRIPLWKRFSVKHSLKSKGKTSSRAS